MNRPLCAAACLAASLWAGPALAAARIVPAQPYAFDPVNLRMTVDSCVFAQDAVAVSASQNVIRVNTRANNCLLPGPERVVDIRLGSLPPGSWRVEVRQVNGDIVLPGTEVIDFAVLDRPEILVFPPVPRPLTDYSGQWYRPAESGWGLSFHQSSTNAVFVAWYVYDPARNPTWYTIQLGRWESATRWSGTIYRTSGPPLFAVPFDPLLVTYSNAGQASVEFEQRPGEEGIATFTYTLNGQSGSRRITRLLF